MREEVKKEKIEEVENDDNNAFPNVEKLVDLMNQLRDCRFKQSIELSRVCFIGDQDSGKSSVLQSIIGLDFLPIREGKLTQRPIELNLHYISSGEPWIEFEEIKGKQFKDFIKVRKTIEVLFYQKYGINENISDKPIVLNVYSQTCPNLTLVDLPKLRKAPIKSQEKNIEEISKSIALRYIKDPLSIIVIVIGVNTDITTSDAFKLAKEIDTAGDRTLVVLTKPDIIDKTIDNNEINSIINENNNLKHGFIIVDNKPKFYLNNNITIMTDINEKEKEEFFKLYPEYKYLNCNYGTNALITKLTKMNFEIVKNNLPKIIKYLNEILKTSEEELAYSGVFVEELGKINLLLNKIDEFSKVFKNILQGKNSNKRISILGNEIGFKIKLSYAKFLEEFSGNYKFNKEFTCKNINSSLSLYEQNSFNEQFFNSILRPKLEQLKNPIETFFKNICLCVDFLSKKVLIKIFSRFPQAIGDMNLLLQNYLLAVYGKTNYLIDSVVDM